MSFQLEFKSFDLASILQLLHFERRTALFRVTEAGQEGYLAFRDGEIIDAKLGALSGYPAAIALLNCSEGQIRVCPETEGRSASITHPLMDLLIDAAQQKNAATVPEAGQLAAAAPGDESSSADESIDSSLLAAFASLTGVIWTGVIQGNFAQTLTFSAPDVIDEITQLIPYFNEILATNRANAITFQLHQPAVIQVTGKFGYFLLTECPTADQYLVVKIQHNAAVEHIIEHLLKACPGGPL